MVTLAALAFLTTLIFFPFVFLPARLFAWFDRDENPNSEDFITMQARFAHVAKRLCVGPLLLSLVAGIYCVTQVKSESQRRIAQEQAEADKAEKTKKYSSTSVYNEPQRKGRFEADRR